MMSPVFRHLINVVYDGYIVLLLSFGIPSYNNNNNNAFFRSHKLKQKCFSRLVSRFLK